MDCIGLELSDYVPELSIGSGCSLGDYNIRIEAFVADPSYTSGFRQLATIAAFLVRITNDPCLGQLIKAPPTGKYNKGYVTYYYDTSYQLNPGRSSVLYIPVTGFPVGDICTYTERVF